MLKAKDLMERNVITVSPRDSVQAAIKKLINNKVSSVMVKDNNENAVGIVTEYDLILAASTVGSGLDVEQVMNREYFIIKTETPLKEIAEMFVANRVKVLPVLDDKSKLVGIVSRRAIIEHLYADA